MRKLLRLLWCVAALSGCLLSFAQEQPVRGTVKDPKDNSPLAGATIVNKRTKKSAATNDQGEYTIAARQGDVLVITHVGRKDQQITVGTARTYVTQLTLAESADMGEVVVTAMDIRRNPRELGYSVQTVGGTEIKESQRENLLNSLQGRVAGVTVTPTTGQAGSSSQIVLRGFNSLSLSNSPLFVVDGVLIDNSTLNQSSGGGTDVGLASDLPNKNNDYTNRIADLSPNDIASMTILKGPEATALYGSQASNGAIIITTRKPKGGELLVAYDDAFRTQHINRFNPSINTFSTGSNGVFTPNYGYAPTYFGPAYPSSTKLYDNEDHFLKTGFTHSHNLSVDFGPKVSSFRFSGSYINQDGVVPTNKYEKVTFRLANTTKIGKYLDITPSVLFVHDVNNKPLRGAGGYLLDLYAWAPDNDVRNYLTPTGHKLLMNPGDSTTPNTELDNPFFNTTANKSGDKTTRVFSTLAINIHPFPWLALAGRFGFDTYHQDGYTLYHPESSESITADSGYQDNYYRRYHGYNHTITATANKDFGKFHGRLMAGTMWQDQRTEQYGVYGRHLTDPNNTDSSNTRPSTRQRLLRNVFGLPNLSIFRDVAYFGEAMVSYDNILFLDFTERFEEASVFPKNNRNYSYPGVSFSAIVSDMIPALKTSRVVNYLKLRASIAQTARLAPPYSNQSVFINSFASSQGFAYGFVNSNEDLKPERQKTYEIGAELKMFNNRVTLDADYYNTLIKDQIIQGYRASYATGFILNTSNVGSTRNQGIEATVGINPVKGKDWNWNILFNFNKMFSKVLSLPPSLTEYYLGDTQIFGSARAGLHKGGTTTTITGYHYQRNNAGDILINPASGLPVVANNWITIGDRNPNFNLGMSNIITYKNWNLSFLWDLKVGGDIYNGTDMYLTLIGKSKRTADRMTARVVKGVLQDGLENTAQPTKNNIIIRPYVQQNFYTQMPDEEFIQKNVNWLRLRDLTLSYTFDGAVMRKLHFLKSLSVFTTVNDLFLFTNYYGADPAVNANTAAESGVGTFGMDYGSLPTPVSVNVGFRTSF